MDQSSAALPLCFELSQTIMHKPLTRNLALFAGGDSAKAAESHAPRRKPAQSVGTITNLGEGGKYWSLATAIKLILDLFGLPAALYRSAHTALTGC
jgi:hypothetical protein